MMPTCPDSSAGRRYSFTIEGVCRKSLSAPLPRLLDAWHLLLLFFDTDATKSSRAAARIPKVYAAMALDNRCVWLEPHTQIGNSTEPKRLQI